MLWSYIFVDIYTHIVRSGSSLTHIKEGKYVEVHFFYPYFYLVENMLQIVNICTSD